MKVKYIYLVVLLFSTLSLSANNKSTHLSEIDSVYNTLSIDGKINCIVSSLSDGNINMQYSSTATNNTVNSWFNLDNLSQDSLFNASSELVRSALIRNENKHLQSLFLQWLNTTRYSGFYCNSKSAFSHIFSNKDIIPTDITNEFCGRIFTPNSAVNNSSFLSLDVYNYPEKIQNAHRPNYVEKINDNITGVHLLHKTQGVNGKQSGKDNYQLFVKTILSHGAIFYAKDKEKACSELKHLFEDKILSESFLDKSCKNSLRQKYMLRHRTLVLPLLSKEQIVNDINIRLHRQGLVLLRNNGIIPVNKLATRSIALLHLGGDSDMSFKNMIRHYMSFKSYVLDMPSDGKIKKLDRDLAKSNTVIITLNEKWVANTDMGRLNSYLKKIALNKDIILCYFGKGDALKKIDASIAYKALALSFDDDSLSRSTMAQLIMGGVAAQGVLPYTINKDNVLGMGEQTTKSRLGYVPAYYSAYPDSLSKIDRIAYKAIRERATPGCQILVAKGGNVIYQKSFGYHTYNKRKHVTNIDLYDLASLTKVTATIPCVMSLYEQGKIDIKDSLSKLIPRLVGGNKSNMKIEDMLVHQAGLVAWIPFYANAIDKEKLKGVLYHRNYSSNYNMRVDEHLYMNKTVRYRTDVFSTVKSGKFNVEVCDKLFMNHEYIDSMKMAIDTSKVTLPARYKYSDLPYYYYKEIIEKDYKKPLQDVVQEKFYKPLGATRVTYLPLQKFPKKEIIPTENDLVWRKDLLQGYVQDQGAAMLGGVGGHAGLFANTESLAKIYQMYLQNGSYGGEQYFKPETMKLFTSTHKKGNRRGLGFDKPETNPHKASPSCRETSPSSFGHSGFTGTLVWVDPKYDLVYIFLSNRVHPYSYNKKLIRGNVRTDIHAAIYHSLPEYWKNK